MSNPKWLKYLNWGRVTTRDIKPQKKHCENYCQQTTWSAINPVYVAWSAGGNYYPVQIGRAESQLALPRTYRQLSTGEWLVPTVFITSPRWYKYDKKPKKQKIKNKKTNLTESQKQQKKINHEAIFDVIIIQSINLLTIAASWNLIK